MEGPLPWTESGWKGPFLAGAYAGGDGGGGPVPSLICSETVLFLLVLPVGSVFATVPSGQGDGIFVGSTAAVEADCLQRGGGFRDRLAGHDRDRAP